MTEPISDEKLAQAMAKARARFASEGLEQMGRHSPESPTGDLTPVARDASKLLEGLYAVQALGEEEYRALTEQEETELLQAWEADRKRARMERLMRQSELPAMFDAFSFTSFDATVSRSAARAAAAALEYASNFLGEAQAGRGLILSGACGTGKTHLAVAIMRHVLQRFEVPSLFATVPGLLESERRSYNDAAARQGPLAGMVESARVADLLILDDLGAQRPSEWVQEKLFYIINHRYAQGLPTVATTNLGLAETAERIGPRSISRLAERCGWVALEGEDYRLKALREKATRKEAEDA